MLTNARFACKACEVMTVQLEKFSRKSLSLPILRRDDASREGRGNLEDESCHRQSFVRGKAPATAVRVREHACVFPRRDTQGWTHHARFRFRESIAMTMSSRARGDGELSVSLRVHPDSGTPVDV